MHKYNAKRKRVVGMDAGGWRMACLIYVDIYMYIANSAQRNDIATRLHTHPNTHTHIQYTYIF